MGSHCAISIDLTLYCHPKSDVSDAPSAKEVVSSTGRTANAQMRKSIRRRKEEKIKVNLIPGEKYEENPFMLTDLLTFFFWAIPLMVYMGIRMYREIEHPYELLGPLLVSYICIEPASGVLHIVLDNQKFNKWVILGEVALSFQKHHDNADEISFRPTHRFMLEPMTPWAVIGTQALFIKSTFTISTIFFLFFMAQLMMFSHRWAHTTEKRKPLIAKVLQRSGIIMNNRHHGAHHKTYDCNFCICAGWANHALNYLTKYVWDEEDMRWFYVLAAAYFFPITSAAFSGSIGHVSVM